MSTKTKQPPLTAAAKSALTAPPIANGRTEVATRFGEVKVVSLAVVSLADSPTNPRKSYSTQEMNDLSASVAKLGVLQPILVRPLTTAKLPAWEIVAGHRRVRAARIAGLKEVPARVLHLSNVEVMEIQLVELEQQAGVSPLEKLDTYLALIDAGRTAEQIAEAVDKSPSSIRAIVRLGRLPGKAREALAEGRISMSIAELIASRPSEAIRNTVAREALKKNVWRRELPTFRELKDFVKRKCCCELKQAPFAQGDAELDPAAGSCTACPKRIGNDPDRSTDGRADVCTDPVCYGNKVALFHERLKRESAGQKFLTGKQAEQIFARDRNRLASDAPYVDFADQCGQDEKKRSYKALLEEHVDPVKDIILAPDRQGNVHKLVPIAKATALLEEHHKIASGVDRFTVRPTLRPAKSASQLAAEKQEREKKRILAETNRELLAQAEEAAAALFEPVASSAAIDGMLRELCLHVAQRCYGNAGEQMCRRRGVSPERMADQQKAIHALVSQTSGAKLLALAVEMTLAWQICGWGRGKQGQTILAGLGIDAKAVEKSVREAAKDGKPKKAAKPDRASESTRTRTAPIIRESSLCTLIPMGQAGNVARAAVSKARLRTVGDLLDAAEKLKGCGPTVYNVLRRVEGLPSEMVFQIGDAVTDGMRPTITRETRLIDLATEGGRDPVVGYRETIELLEGVGVFTAGQLLDRARQRTGKRYSTALFEAIRQTPKVSADMAKRVVNQLEDLLQPLWGDPSSARDRLAERQAAQRCRVCGCTEADCRGCIEKLGHPCTWVEDDLCSACADEA